MAVATRVEGAFVVAQAVARKIKKSAGIIGFIFRTADRIESQFRLHSAETAALATDSGGPSFT